MIKTCFASLLFCTSAIFAIDPDMSFREFITQHNIPLRPDGKIAIPEHIKHVKLDIGLSYNAPHSQYWLSHEEDLLVFGFEPNPDSVDEIRKGAIKKSPYHGTPLDVKYIDKQFFLVPCALGIPEGNKVNFFITKEDAGCSSIYEPTILAVEKKIEVPIFSLADFFDLFPFETCPLIEYIKIDAQGADLDIVKSAGHFLEDYVIFITLEAENKHYKDTKNSVQDIENYMGNIGFIRYRTQDTGDPTYLNRRFSDYVNTHQVKIYQRD